jgi:O-methyltransferase
LRFERIVVMRINDLIRYVVRSFGYECIPKKRADELYFAGAIPYTTDEETRIMNVSLPYTQTGKERLFSLLRATRYISQNRICGAFVECGVWKGGSMMAASMMLDAMQELRDIYLFDTFSGMPRGVSLDVDLEGNTEEWYREKSDQYVHFGKGNAWNNVSLEDVKRNVAHCSRGSQRFHFVEGKVEDTVPSRAPESIALLRLDTDFYESTRHELIHLYPRLVEGGVLIIDDYGHFLGARKAVDEYFSEKGLHPFLHRIDYSGVISIKA